MKNVEALSIRDLDAGALIAVKAVAAASRDRIIGVLGDCLKIATAQPAEKGRANIAVAAILAGALGIDKRDVEVVAGRTGPRKDLYVAALSAEQIRELLAKV